eukprot:TRINITY_DN8398_c0_g2_i1.p1 TRINITY_DN8398_c0_g2~~TRINITY_DN8398_c0_g2_i1.p1  ORF type:complete len:544 (-),score=122.35 TRINITY_DN8398_c0_g2_i1:109-1536(-)
MTTMFSVGTVIPGVNSSTNPAEIIPTFNFTGGVVSDAAIEKAQAPSSDRKTGNENNAPREGQQATRGRGSLRGNKIVRGRGGRGGGPRGRGRGRGGRGRGRPRSGSDTTSKSDPKTSSARRKPGRSLTMSATQFNPFKTNSANETQQLSTSAGNPPTSEAQKKEITVRPSSLRDRSPNRGASRGRRGRGGAAAVENKRGASAGELCEESADSPPSVRKKKVVNQQQPAPQQQSTDSGTETVEAANVRLIAHVKALQVELRKYMQISQDSQNRITQLERALASAKNENEKLSREPATDPNAATQIAALKKDMAMRYKKALHNETEKSKRGYAREAEKAVQQRKRMSLAHNEILQFFVGTFPEQETGKPLTTFDHRILKTGYLVKQGSLVKNWKRRMFILRDNYQLLYYSAAERPDPRGVLDLRDVTQVRASANLEIEIKTKTRVWLLKTDTAAERDEWVGKLKQVLAPKEKKNLVL